ncbi:hypothetical protein SDC9_52496 [bioreactor metagenome]|uniref:Uncharacterized protein n=1 Tax=bioreactor metagenome TaxID=1076179 RepID=A0A644WQT9_9ZZZZ
MLVERDPVSRTYGNGTYAVVGQAEAAAQVIFARRGDVPRDAPKLRQRVDNCDEIRCLSVVVRCFVVEQIASAFSAFVFLFSGFCTAHEFHSLEPHLGPVAVVVERILIDRRLDEENVLVGEHPDDPELCGVLVLADFVFSGQARVGEQFGEVLRPGVELDVISVTASVRHALRNRFLQFFGRHFVAGGHPEDAQHKPAVVDGADVGYFAVLIRGKLVNLRIVRKFRNPEPQSFDTRVLSRRAHHRRGKGKQNQRAENQTPYSEQPACALHTAHSSLI